MTRCHAPLCRLQSNTVAAVCTSTCPAGSYISSEKPDDGLPDLAADDAHRLICWNARHGCTTGTFSPASQDLVLAQHAAAVEQLEALLRAGGGQKPQHARTRHAQEEGAEGGAVVQLRHVLRLLAQQRDELRVGQLYGGAVRRAGAGGKQRGSRRARRGSGE